MSSIMRRRSGLMAISVIGGSCLEDEVANSSILKTGRRPHHHPFTSPRSSRALPCAQRPPARAGSFCGTKRTLRDGLLYARKLPFIAHRGPMLLRNEPPPRPALLKTASSCLSYTEAASAVSRLGVARALALPRLRTIEKG